MHTTILTSGHYSYLADAPARQFARPYLFIRGFAFLPSMFSLIGFSAFRGEIMISYFFRIHLLHQWFLMVILCYYNEHVQVPWIQLHL